MKTLSILLCLLFTISAQADWVIDTNIDKLTTEVPDEIVYGLIDYPDVMAHLNAENLVSPSKLIVRRLEAETNLWRWENDSECQVADTEKIQKVKLRQILVTYNFKDTPQEEVVLGTYDMASLPCNEISIRPKVKMTKQLQKKTLN